MACAEPTAKAEAVVALIQGRSATWSPVNGGIRAGSPRCKSRVKGVSAIEITARQEQIIQIVKNNSPITGERIAALLNVRRATLRPDLAVLTMAGLLDARPG